MNLDGASRGSVRVHRLDHTIWVHDSTLHWIDNIDVRAGALNHEQPVAIFIQASRPVNHYNKKQDRSMDPSMDSGHSDRSRHRKHVIDAAGRRSCWTAKRRWCTRRLHHSALSLVHATGAQRAPSRRRSFWFWSILFFVVMVLRRRLRRRRSTRGGSRRWTAKRARASVAYARARRNSLRRHNCVRSSETKQS